MSRRKRFFINGIILTLTALSVKTVSMWHNSYVSENVGAEGVGLFAVILTVYSFALTLATSGISLTVTRLVSEAIGKGREDRIGKILKSSFLYALVFSLVSSVLLYLFAPLLGIRVVKDVRAVIPLRILSLSLAPVSLNSVIGGYFIGVRRIRANATIGIIGQLLKIFLTVLLLSMNGINGVSKGITALSLTVTGCEITVLFISLLRLVIDRKRCKSTKEALTSELKAVCGMALPLAISGYIRSALLTLEHVMIPKRLEKGGETHSSALSSYGILHGMALPTLLYPMTPLSSFSGLLVPEFSESFAAENKKRLSRIAGEAMSFTLSYSLICSCLIMLFSEELGYALYSSYEAGRYVCIMAAVIPVMYLDHVADSMLKGIGEHVYSMWVNITDSILSIVLVYLLVPYVGIMGYGASIMIMEGYNFTMSVIRLKKRISFKISFFKYGLLPLAASFISALTVKMLFTDQGSEARFLPLFAKLIFSFALIIAAILSLKLFKKRSTFSD